ncbi:TetR/AcrR family transcriptional regulator [Azotosporobacter soli]|uniref:TetR/AcrR family transcriptional regulator n=1 Tax=Azotosporobacter soli TaxID=3055040 RepID=UPI0031FE81DF
MATRVGLDRKEIIMAAAEIADQEGLSKLTLKLVAQRLGVKTPSLYNHMEGLPELKRAMAVWGTQLLKETISEAAIGKAKAEAVLAIAVAYRSFAHQRPGLYRAIIAAPDRECVEQKEAIASLMAVIKRVLKAYALPEDKHIHAVRGLRSMMHGFVTLEMAGWFVGAVEKEESYLQLIATFVNGITLQSSAQTIDAGK